MLTLAAVTAVLQDAYHKPRQYVRGTYRECLTFVEAQRYERRTGRRVDLARLGVAVEVDEPLARIFKERYDDERLRPENVESTQESRARCDGNARGPVDPDRAEKRERVGRLRVQLRAAEDEVRRLERELDEAES